MQDEPTNGRRKCSPSLRWAVFARDGFTCRYCGAQAGQDGVELHADHVLSVIEGGTTTFDNLVTSCQKCNGGKGARSLQNAPTGTEVVDRLNQRAATLMQQADAMAAVIRAQQAVEDRARELKCRAYQAEYSRMAHGEEARIAALCREFGADKVLEWYTIAYSRGIRAGNAIQYVCGIVRNIRNDASGQ